MKGLVYNLEIGNQFYIGSTTQTLQKRMNHHRDNSKSKTGALFDAIRTVGKDNIKIHLLEELEITCKNQLYEREKFFLSQVDKSKCLNKNTPIRSDEEKQAQARASGKKWYDTHKKVAERTLKKNDPDYNKNRWKNWADNNRDYLRERYKEQDAIKRIRSNCCGKRSEISLEITDTTVRPPPTPPA